MSLQGYQDFSVAQREVLIEHVDGWFPFERQGYCSRNKTVSCLIARGLLSFHNGERGGWVGERPRQTFLTVLGREVLCALLADYADVLSRARSFADFPATARIALGAVAEKPLVEPLPLGG